MWCERGRCRPLRASARLAYRMETTTASAGRRWPCGITNRELYHW